MPRDEVFLVLLINVLPRRPLESTVPRPMAKTKVGERWNEQFIDSIAF